ncbi:hypothetical protein NEOC84_000926|nr:hypothetical protein [Neochlamydia sp. AcF84]
MKISPKELISEASYAKTVEIVEGYRAFKTTSCHAGLEQRWVVIFSQAAYQREYPTLSKHDLRAMQKKPKPLLSSCNKSFYVQTMLNVN